MKSAPKTPLPTDNKYREKVMMNMQFHHLLKLQSMRPFAGFPVPTYPLMRFPNPQFLNFLLDNAGPKDPAYLNARANFRPDESGMKANNAINLENLDKGTENDPKKSKYDTDTTSRVRRMLGGKYLPNFNSENNKPKQDNFKTAEKYIEEIVDDDECVEIMSTKKVKKGPGLSNMISILKKYTPKKLIKNSKKEIIILEAGETYNKDEVISLDSELSIEEISLIPDDSTQNSETKIQSKEIPTGTKPLKKLPQKASRKLSRLDKRSIESKNEGPIKNEGPSKNEGHSNKENIKRADDNSLLVEQKFAYSYDTSIYKYNRQFDIDPTNL